MTTTPFVTAGDATSSTMTIPTCRVTTSNICTPSLTAFNNPHPPRHCQRQHLGATSSMPTTPTNDNRHVTINDNPLCAMTSTKTTPTNSEQLPLPSSRDVGAEIDGWERGGVRRMRGCKGMGNEEAGGNIGGRGRLCMPPPSLLFIPQANEAV